MTNSLELPILDLHADIPGAEDEGKPLEIIETIAAGAYGLLQVYGYHSAGCVRTMTSTGHVYHESRAAVAAGTPLVGGITAAAVLIKTWVCALIWFYRVNFWLSNARRAI